MAAPIVQSKGTAAAVASGTTVSPTRPGSIAANDIEILFANSYTGAGSNNTTYTDPVGWTRITATAYVNQFFANNGMLGLWWRRAAGGESGTVSLVRGGTTSNVFHAQLYRISGCITSGNPYDAFTVFTGSGGASITYSSVTAAGNERTLLALAVTITNAAITLPSGYSTLVRDGTASGATSSLEAFHLANQLAGSYSSSSASGGGTNGSGSVHLAFAPAAAAATSLVARSRGAVAHVLR